MKLLERPVLLFAAGLFLVALGIALYLVSAAAGASVSFVGLAVICASPFARAIEARRRGTTLPYAGEAWLPGAEIGPEHHHHGGDSGGGDGGGFFGGDFGGGGGGDGGGGGG